MSHCPCYSLRAGIYRMQLYCTYHNSAILIHTLNRDIQNKWILWMTENFWLQKQLSQMDETKSQHIKKDLFLLFSVSEADWFKLHTPKGVLSGLHQFSCLPKYPLGLFTTQVESFILLSSLRYSCCPFLYTENRKGISFSAIKKSAKINIDHRRVQETLFFPLVGIRAEQKSHMIYLEANSNKRKCNREELPKIGQ